MSPQFRQSIKYFRHNKKNHLSTIGTTELTFKKFEVNKSIDVYNRNSKFQDFIDPPQGAQSTPFNQKNGSADINHIQSFSQCYTKHETSQNGTNRRMLSKKFDSNQICIMTPDSQSIDTSIDITLP